MGKEDSVDQIQAIFEEGKRLFDKGLLKEAKLKLLEYVRIETTDIDAYHLIAQVFWESHQKQEAIQLLQEALSQDPSHQGVRATLEKYHSPGSHPLNHPLPFFQPPNGNTEQYIGIQILNSLDTSSVYQAIKDYSIEGIGVGFEGLDFIVNHIFKKKLAQKLSPKKNLWNNCIVLNVNLEVLNAQTQQSFGSHIQSVEDISLQFAQSESQDRLECINRYKQLIQSGQDLGKIIYLTGAVLNEMGATVENNSLYMIDGARRLTAHAIAHSQSLPAQIIMPNKQYAQLLKPSKLSDLSQKFQQQSWFNNYQTIDLVSLKGERTTRRFDLMDLNLFKDKRIMDFGCNIGQACIQAVQSGAKEVCGVEGMPDTWAVASDICDLIQFPNLQYLNVDFNQLNFWETIERDFPGQTDFSFFFSVFRTKELIQREVLFQYIIEKTSTGIFYEGHADPEIDTLKYHSWLFESFGLSFQFLGYSEANEIRPLFYLDTANRRPRPGQQDLNLILKPAPAPTFTQTSSVEPYLVSAIVSTYNSEAFMRRRLENLVQQSLGSQLEIVVIDSHSPQNESAIVKEFQQQYDNIKLLRTEERETVYQAWNRGIKMAQGKYVTNANTDDLLRKDALEKLAMSLEANSQYALAYGDFYITHLPNQTFENHIRIGYSHKPDYDPSIMLSGCHMGPQPLWRKSLHEDYGYFDENLVAAGDYEFWCRLASHGHQFIHLNEYLGLYLHNLEGICNSNLDRVQSEARGVKSKYQHAFPTVPNQPLPTGYYYKQVVPSDKHYVNIGMITYNRLDFTKQTIASLLVKTKYPHVLTVVDNNSTDGTQEYLKALQSLGVIHNLILLDENVGVAKASNLAWNVEPDAEYYLKLDNDIILQKDSWLEDMVKTYEAIPEVGVLGYNFEPKSYPLETINGFSIQTKRERGNIGGAVQLIPKRTSHRLGFWCEEYGLYGEEDLDYGIRTRFAGLINAYMPDNEMGFHLPAGKAAVIDTDNFDAKDGQEEKQDREYREWKDTQRRANMGEDGRVHQNVHGYQTGSKPLKMPSPFSDECLKIGNQSLLKFLKNNLSQINTLRVLNQMLARGESINRDIIEHFTSSELRNILKSTFQV